MRIPRRHLPNLASLVVAVSLSLAGAIATFGPVGFRYAQAAAGQAATEEGGRIVAIGGAVTEILYALGLEQRVAGVDTTSLYPAEALRTKANIGYFRNFSAEGVISLKPSLVIAAEGAGSADSIKLVRDAGVAFERLPDDLSPESIAKKIETIGHLVHAEDRAGQLSHEVAEGLRDLAALRAEVKKPTRALLVLALQGGRPLVGGRGTAADTMIGLAGGLNVADGFDGYKPMTDESIIAASPDIIVAMGRDGRPTAKDIFDMPAFAMTPAAAHKSFVAMDGLYLLGMGPRAPQAAKELFQAFYPAATMTLAEPRP